MTVTRIEEVTKAKCRIELDEEFAFVLYKGELRQYHIREGEELSEQDYEEITKKLLPKRAKLRAMNLLKSRPYTEHDLRQKLSLNGYPAEVLEEAIAYVRSYHYLDDRQYALDYIAYRKETKTFQQLKQSLLQKGVTGELITECYEELVGGEKKALEEEQILKFLLKKNYCAESCTYEEKQRLMAALYRKGFSSDAIHHALSLDITSNYV